jgi:hypothetical protein
MSTLRIYAAVAALIAILVVAYSWHEFRADRARLRATLASQQQVISAVESRERAGTAQLKSTLDQIAALKRQIQTPQQIVNSLPQYLPLPAPIQLIPAPPTKKGTSAPLRPEQETAASPRAHQETSASPRPQQGITNWLQSASGAAEIPAADLKPLYDFVQDCRACQAELTSARADLKDEQARSAALARERNAAITAAKGGSLWRQLKRNARWLAIGAIVGAAAAAAHSR